MISKRRQLHSILVILSILVLADGNSTSISLILTPLIADFEDLFTNIKSISTESDTVDAAYRYSSLEGGAYLYIKGSGFSTRSASSNKVLIGDYECPVVGKYIFPLNPTYCL